ncbi:MAG TPA: hypothetical protein VF597_02385 [Candidatus Saccharimonadales bacterium]|jgi:hypothetical protein
MSKLPMYILLSVGMGVGGWLPTLFGQPPLGGWSILGTVIGGGLCVWVYWQLRQNGYLE